MISTDQDPFGRENSYSSLTVTDKGSGRVLFRSPVPALSRLWISPDSRFVLGLSEVKLWNPYQVVLFDRMGPVLLKRRISSEEAQLTRPELAKLLAAYPRARTEIERLSHEEGGKVYVDFDDPRRLYGAWDVLNEHRRRSHFSPNFSESVTNVIHWLDADAKPRVIERSGRPTALELRDPRGQPFRIPIPGDPRFDEVSLETADAFDGIDKLEARQIAGAYYGLVSATPCSDLAEPTRKGGAWSFRVGDAAEKTNETIKVDARTGAVWGMGPRFPSLEALRAEASRPRRSPWPCIED
jgi:hypothetical protein